jgi:hypothetical protein
LVAKESQKHWEEPFMRRTPSPAMFVACIALFVALGGTAVAADHYLITSTSQIKPSVVKQLRGAPVAKAAAKKAVTDVVARVRTLGAVEPPVTGAEISDPVSGATWSQRADELDEFVDGAIVDTQSTPACRGGTEFASIVVQVVLDKSKLIASEVLEGGDHPGEISTGIVWTLPPEVGREHPWLAEPGQATSHTVTLDAREICPFGETPTHPVEVTSVSFDVIGVP